MKFEKEKYEEMAKIVKAMAHPTRLFIVDMLQKRKHCVCEFNATIDADFSTISKHLAVLKKAGIIESEKKGNNVYYALRTPCILSFFSCVVKVIEKG